VAVEKLDISEIRENFGDRKCLSVQRKSFVGHPNAIQFLQISGKRVFQQPRDISTAIADWPRERGMLDATGAMN
jgi:hypothetical protein